MTTLKQIRDFGQQLGEVFRPTRIILFGSYATGKAGDDSDVDLLVEIAHEGSGLRKAAEMIRTLRPSFPVDLIVRRPEDVVRRLSMNDPFLKSVISEGSVIYDAARN